MYCKECAYWKPEYEYMGSCISEKFTYTAEWDNTVIPKDGLNYFDAEGYKATLRTGKDFGCIHFKQK